MGFFRNEFEKIIQNEKIGEIINENIKEVIKEQIFEESLKDLFEEEVEKEVENRMKSFMQMLYDEYKMRLIREQEEMIAIQDKKFIYEPPEKKIYFRQGLLRGFDIFNEVFKEFEKILLKHQLED